jgi:drug/metabolite transporter (DMT)-like permease
MNESGEGPRPCYTLQGSLGQLHPYLTWVAVAALGVVGGVAMFALYLVVLRRWTASAASCGFVAFPVVMVPSSSRLEGRT